MVSRTFLRTRPVQSLKHVIDTASSAILAVVTTVPLATADDNPSQVVPVEIHNGSTISSIYLRCEVISTTSYTQVPRVYMIVFKDPSNAIGIPDPNAVGQSNKRKFVIHQEMIMLSGVPATSEFPRTLFQGVIKIPPRLRRFGFNDRLEVGFQNGVGETTGIANVCVQCIYKEFQ